MRRQKNLEGVVGGVIYWKTKHYFFFLSYLNERFAAA